MYQSCMPVSELYLEIILPSSLHSVYDVELLAEDNAKETELPGFTDELLFEPVEELDFSELLDLAEDFPPVEDFTELLEELSPLEAGASFDFAELEGRSPTASGKTDEESSPQAVRLIVAIRARTGREKNFMSRGG